MEKTIVKDIISQIHNYGKNFYVQWHLTSKCTESCKHCYMDKHMVNDGFNMETSLNIIDQISYVASSKEIKAIIAFTGGDPLLFPDIYNLIDYSNGKNIDIVIKGTPWLVTQDVAKELKKLGIKRFQLSIDGLEKTHDFIRKKGSFKKTIECIKLLKRHEIEILLKYTVSTININETKSTLRYVSELGVDYFDFARYAPGNTEEEKYMVDKHSYRELLIDLLYVYEDIKHQNSNFSLLFRDHLWMLLFRDLGILTDEILNKISNNIYPIAGCSMANNNGIVINYNGDVLPCAKVPEYILGNILNEELSEIIIKEKYISLRHIENYLKCSKCKIRLLCRGCPAVSYYKNKSVFDPDIQCWSDII